MDPIEQFQEEVERNIVGLGRDTDVQALSRIWVREIARHKWAYNFAWLGRPAIQFPNDTWAMQEIIWDVRPDLIIETGIAHGGSLIFSASMLALLEFCDAAESGRVVDPAKPQRRVLGIDIDIRAHNRKAIEAHPLSARIDMLEGSSIDPETIAQVAKAAESAETVLICLDSNHTHDHVLEELQAYAPMTTVGSYCVVFDTIVEDMPDDLSGDRPWGVGNNPKTAARAFLADHPEFEVDRRIDHKLQISVAPEGFLRRIA
ncbi:cephalosporin hydroxylase [Rhodobacterales bacterium HKCCE3408]|nr:cephalosporin hydroxylase [Rhodobacterales bacterium HKCCE3408]